MNRTSTYLIQVLEKIGLPLMSAIIEVEAGASQNGQDAQGNEARRMAELLTRTTQASLEIAGTISPSNALQSDGFRLALAALTAPIIADHYRYDRQVPGDADLKKIISALQTVVTFSDNFEADIANTQALQSLDRPAKILDASQIALHQLMAFTPVVNAAGSFSFGQNEPKLLRDIAERLVQKSTQLSVIWSADGPDAETKMVGLEILKVLAKIYAACHQSETARLNTGGDAASGLENVWRNFDLRVAMLEALASTLLDSSGTVAGPAPTGATPPPSFTQQQQPAPLAPPQTSPAASVPTGGGFNPMGNFAKKPEPTDATPPASPPTAPPSGGGFNPMGNFAKKPVEDEMPPPAAPPPSITQDPEKSPDSTSNPMGFFKPGTKKDDA